MIVDRMPLAGNPHVVGLAQAGLPAVIGADSGVISITTLHQRLREDAASVPEFDSVLATIITQANSEFFRFDVSELHEDGGPSTTRLHSGPQGATPLPTSVLSADAATRKLTVMYLLDEALPDAATIRLPLVGKRRPLTPGSVYVWPAFLESEITGVQDVEVYVTHACGRSFR
ncbi:hypothetical protein [Candidatus Microthrix parvicella]|uniref:hypothetical protein n=1 Tax=Candidatus Neomicrothrix parvicella TaxID=41950 RepID=UPI0012FE08CB|nr:hypothetical protein [Candidatus Microthrix parvicella]